MNRRVRVSVAVAGFVALTLSLGVSLPVRAVEFKYDKQALNLPGKERTSPSTNHAGVELTTFDHAFNNTTAKDQFKGKRSEDGSTIWEVAQFQLPKHKEQMFRQEGFGEPPSPLITHLKYDYSYGSESEINYRKNPDLTNRLKDDSLILTPEINAYITYRPTNWLEMTLETILDREIGVVEEDFVVLPDGDIEFPEKREWSLLVDQAFFTIKNAIDPFKITVGRKNYEDERHWLYDTSMDVAMISHKAGKFRTEATFGREVWVDMDVFKPDKPDRINTFMLYTDYRGFEDIKVGAYTIYRDDRAGEEGRPILFGLRSQGMPNNNLSYWLELAYMTGKDSTSKDFSAHAVDFGVTYRFHKMPFSPNVTLGYAFASGDDPNDATNTEFRQTGLQSNESKFAGVAEFLTYGEALDPELSNLKILTAGIGFRPWRSISLDFVYHSYQLDETADELRNSEITAQLNQGTLSKDVGSGFDIVMGMRSLFGVKRLGMDLRGGWFFPGTAFKPDGPDKGFSVVTKFWW